MYESLQLMKSTVHHMNFGTTSSVTNSKSCVKKWQNPTISKLSISIVPPRVGTFFELIGLLRYISFVTHIAWDFKWCIPVVNHTFCIQQYAIKQLTLVYHCCMPWLRHTIHHKNCCNHDIACSNMQFSSKHNFYIFCTMDMQNVGMIYSIV